MCLAAATACGWVGVCRRGGEGEELEEACGLVAGLVLD
jgi:hypothetical protein